MSTFDLKINSEWLRKRKRAKIKVAVLFCSILNSFRFQQWKGLRVVLGYTGSSFFY